MCSPAFERHKPVGFQRQFHLTEEVGLRFRAEFFDILNHPDFGPPNNSLPNPLFGHSTQKLASSVGSGGANGGFNPLYQIGGPRSIQLALKPCSSSVIAVSSVSFTQCLGWGLRLGSSWIATT